MKILLASEYYKHQDSLAARFCIRCNKNHEQGIIAVLRRISTLGNRGSIRYVCKCDSYNFVTFYKRLL